MTCVSRVFTAFSVFFILAACSATQPVTRNPSPQGVNPPSSIIQSSQTEKTENSQRLTLEQIMADPDWLGRQPEDAYWADSSDAFLYYRKREGSPLKDLWQVSLEADNNGELVTIPRLHEKSYEDRVISADKLFSAWIFKNNIFVKFSQNNKIYQLTRDNQSRSDLMFLTDGRLSFRMNDAFYTVDVRTGLTYQLMSWTFAKKPTANQPIGDYIAGEQQKLIEYVGIQREERQQRFDNDNLVARQNNTITAMPFYFPAEHQTVSASLSPNGRYAIIVEKMTVPWRGDDDLMPNYIADDGRIKTDKVRRRVADAKPEEQFVWLVDIEKHQQKELSYRNLPGYNDDVLAAVKSENAKARGESYKINRLPRNIGLIVDWSWDQSAIQWHSSGDHVAIMLEAWDNKDRWIATVDFDKQILVNQHRLHDDAWINYKFNSFGWLNTSTTLYFLSEQSGYANLYTKSLDSQSVSLVSGQFEVDQLTVSENDKYIYFQANKKHPGIYEIYRVATASGEIEQLTDLDGYTDYQLSPDNSKLLLTHSKLTQPPELYYSDLASSKTVRRITHTVSKEFSQINWLKPDVIAVNSSHVDQPIYSRVYKPQDVMEGEKRKAVIFSHGAGYLQNSHLGWSNYFREYMFHNLLVQQGYVVMDMDYRASAGYGRDWRTAIYRHMGKPEIEDLKDGVNWLVQNANVDVGRVGTYGGSYGGFMTFMALFTEPDLFQAGAALRPVTDWAHYNAPYTSNILNTPDVDPIAYERSSPLYFAEGLSKPLLINAPMVDSNVFFVDVVRLVQRLIELEKVEFETAIYPVESHGFVQPSSWLDEYRRIFKLFETHL